MSGPRNGAVARVALVVALLALFAVATGTRGQESPAGGEALEAQAVDAAQSLAQELSAAAIRLPLAAALGALLAWRPRRNGSPRRRSAVIETQIVLAAIGALVVLAVGTNLARAFGIVGIASLIRYRSKVNDPKDAVVMLSALGVGLASGSGLYALAIFATLFLVALLWFLEGFERQIRVFELSVRLGDSSPRLQPAVERLLRRFNVDYELRGASEQGSTYQVAIPGGVSTNRMSKELAALARDGKGAVEWSERAKSQAE